MKELKETLDRNGNMILTENGATGYSTTTRNPLVDLNFRVPSRHCNVGDNELMDFTYSLHVNFVETIKWMFYLRDVREGLGERVSFVRLFCILNDLYPDVAVKLVPLIPEYGRYKDLIDILECHNDDSVIGQEIYNFINMQLKTDLINMSENKPVSLLAKWMPSINASIKARKMAKRFAKKFGLPFVDYRKMLSNLRKYIDVTEVKTCGNKWTEIDYNKVSSNANIRYTDAFMKHDYDRRMKYIESLSKPESKSKMNASTLYPYEIYAKYCRNMYQDKNEDKSLEEMWKNLKSVESIGHTLCVCDNSGSMTTLLPGCLSTRAIDVSRSLSVFFSERCTSEFKDKIIAFSSHPYYIDLSNCKSLVDKINVLNKCDDCSNTNIKRTFDLVLKTAIDNNLSQSDLPDNILIISDMEFDYATVTNGYSHEDNMSKYKTLFENIRTQWESYGYKLPKLIFWNVLSRTNAIQLTENECGVILVSGFSVNNVKMVLSGELDPYKALKFVLDSKRYDKVEDVLKS